MVPHIDPPILIRMVIHGTFYVDLFLCLNQYNTLIFLLKSIFAKPY